MLGVERVVHIVHYSQCIKIYKELNKTDLIPHHLLGREFEDLSLVFA